MEQNTDKHIDELARKVFKDSSLEKPSLDFTSNVMASIEEKTESVITYKPLISKMGWFLIIVALSAISIYTMLSNNENSVWLSAFDYSVVSKNSIIEFLSGIKFSEATMYVAGLFGLAWLVQLSLIKNYYEKQLEY